MSDPDKKPWYAQLPAKLAAAVVFLVALTTLVGNIIELIEKRRQPVAKPVPAASAPAPRIPPVSEPQPARTRLQVDRIVVHVDGSPGTTDWRFAVEVDDTPLFVFAQDALTDQAGRNVATPEGAAGGILPRSDGKPVRLKVRGWRGSRLRLPGSEPDVGGDVVVVPRGILPPMIVQGDSDDAGSFEFHFSATKVD